MAVEFDPGNGGGDLPESVETGFTSGGAEEYPNGGFQGFAEDPLAGFGSDIAGAEETIYSLILAPIASVPSQSIPSPLPPLAPPTAPCPEGTTMQCAPCLAEVCTAVCTPVCAPTNAAAIIQDPLALISSILGGIGGRGGPLPIGTAGTRLVAAEQKKSPIALIVILAVLGGLGYWWYRRRKAAQG